MTQATASSRPANAGKPRNSTSPWRNPWLIAWVGLIVVVLGVNITMVTLAIATNPGLVVDDYYERGRETERTIVSRLAESAAWTMSVDIPADLRVGEPETVRFFVVDRAGQPARPESVTYYAYRPSDATRDFERPMREEAPGRYAAELTFPLPGIWDALVVARLDDGEAVIDQRIQVAGP